MSRPAAWRSAGPRPRPHRIAFAAAALVSCCVLGLTGCTGAAPEPSPSHTGTGTTATAAPTTTPTPTSAPTLRPDAGAEANLAYFDAVNRRTLEANPDATGKDFIAGLVKAGFPKDAMQLTAGITTVGLEADSIQFSVRMGHGCLLGQNGSGSGGYQSEVAPVLATGTCLIGDTVDLG